MAQNNKFNSPEMSRERIGETVDAIGADMYTLLQLLLEIEVPWLFTTSWYKIFKLLEVVHTFLFLVEEEEEDERLEEWNCLTRRFLILFLGSKPRY